MTTPSEGYFVLQTWPESERMRCYLSAESQESDKCYTMPGIKSNPVTVDSNAVTAGDLLNTNVAHSNPPANMDGIKQLIGSGNFRAALDFTATLLTSLGQGFGMTGVPSRNTAETLELWTCRFQLLQALEMHQWLIDELAAFEELDAPDLYFQFYPSVYGAERKGSLVPFSLRLIHAECLRFTKMPWKSLKRVDVLEKNVAEVIECLKHTSLPSALAGVWQSRLMLVQSLRARILVALNEYGTSMIIYNRIATVTNNEHFRTALKFLLFRIAMVMGDSRKMEHFAKEISLLPGSDQNLISFLMSVFHGNFSSAEEHLKEIAARGDKITNTNNTAVCKMYNGGATAAYDLLRKYDGSHCKPSIMNLMTIADLIVCDSTKEKIAFFTDNLDRLLDMSDLLTLKVSK